MIQTPLILCDSTQWYTDFLSGAFAEITGGIVLLLLTVVLIPWLSRHRWRKEQISTIPESLRKNYLYKKIYIQPYKTTTPPHSHHEPAKLELTDTELLRDFFINKVFIRDSQEPNNVYLLFGDTGTGKSTALIHLFSDYINNYTKKSLPYQIRLISLREDDALAIIQNIQDKENHILLLDALDESPLAQDIHQYNTFLQQLKAAFRDFARVVITFRPQFFSQKQPETDLIQPKQRTSTGWLKCTEFYLAPFSNTQVQAYLDQAISFRSNNKKRQKAETLVNKQTLIFIRPLVLTYIKDIVDSNREANTTLDIFDIIIEKTLQRDLDKTYPDPKEEWVQKWWDTSSLVASHMYNTHTLSISEQELDKILSSTKTDTQFKQRSLLTRSDNEYHFSHKSFYEYFMSYRFLFHPEEAKYVWGMGFALQLYEDLLDAHRSQKQVLFADLKKLPAATLAQSLHTIGLALYNIYHFTEAELKYEAALAIYQDLEDQHPGIYTALVAKTLGNLAILHCNTNNHSEAEKEYNKSYGYYKQLAEKSPDDFLPQIARTLHNLGNLYFDTQQNNKAEENYNDALHIRRVLAKNNPDVYLPNLASTLHNLGALYKKTNQYEKAEESLNEALHIFQELAKKKPDDYMHNVASTLNNMGALYNDTKQYNKVEEIYTEALRIYQELAKKTPDVYLPDVAVTLYNMSRYYFYRDDRNLPAAEDYAQKCLKKFKAMAEKNHITFDKYVQLAEELLANIQEAMGTR